jgi:hypothetical protein
VESKQIKRNEDDLPDVRDDQQNYERSVSQGLSFLYDPLGALSEEISAIR